MSDIMFRKIRRTKQTLPTVECYEILKTEPRGVMAVYGIEGYPYAFPLNYVLLDNKMYFHCATEGHKLEAIAKNNKVSFCVMDKGYQKDNHWSLNIRSVIVFGTVEIVKDDKLARIILQELGNKYYPKAESVEEEIQKHFSHVKVLELSIHHISGKIVNES